MTCARAPQLTEFEFLMALDGAADPEVAMHIEACPDCQDRLDQLRKLHTRVADRLFRADCPSSIDIGEYHLGLLAAAQASAIDQHLATCPWCSGERAVLNDFMADAGLSPRLDFLTPVRDTVKVIVARLAGALSGGGFSGQPGLAPAWAGLRGMSQGPLLYEAEGVQVMAEIAEDASHPGRKTILGLLTGTFPAASFQAYLWQAARYCATTPVTDLGNFAIDNLAPGNYSLVLSGPDLEIHLEDLPVAVR